MSLSIPDGYQQVMPYLIVKNANQFSEFVKMVFNGKEVNRHMRDEKIIMHAELKIGDSIIMFAEAVDPWKPQNAGMFIYVENADETFQVAINHGAEVLMQPANQPYGRSCGVKDPFGNIWWITSVLPK
jgi:PhnB protein